MRNKIVSCLLCFSVAVFNLAYAEDINSSTSLQTYYATANNLSNNELRLALHAIINTHTQVTYKQLGVLMQWSDTEGADGTHVYDIYTNCSYTVSGAITWGNASSVGNALNREHTVPQSWFNEDSPMVSDAFHVYPSDCKANNNRSSYLYGEFEGAGTSYSSSKCAETGKLSTGTDNSIASYTYNNQTYAPTETWTGKVYEVEDEYKGDIARSYFYMATCYASGNGTANCSNWSGGAFGNDNNGLAAYTAALMLKWHRLDPVSEKELIRNEAIYGNTLYNKSDKKQNNRNPFIDFPELVEYIWGDKKNVSVTLSALDSPYANESPLTDIDQLETAPTARKILVGGQIYMQVNDQLFNLQGQRVK